MGFEALVKKLRLGKWLKRRAAPRWCDIRKFGLKRARTRRIQTKSRHWRRVKKKA